MELLCPFTLPDIRIKKEPRKECKVGHSKYHDQSNGSVTLVTAPSPSFHIICIQIDHPGCHHLRNL